MTKQICGYICPSCKIIDGEKYKNYSYYKYRNESRRYYKNAAYKCSFYNINFAFPYIDNCYMHRNTICNYSIN